MAHLNIQGKVRDAERGGKLEFGLWMDWIGLSCYVGASLKWIADALHSLRGNVKRECWGKNLSNG